MSINVGDSYEVNVFGHRNKGFVMSYFMVAKKKDGTVDVLSYILIDSKNSIIFFRSSDVVHTSRVVLTEKIKYPSKLNEEFNQKLYEARLYFLNQQSFHRSRQIGNSYNFAQSAFLNLGKKGKQATIITGKSNTLTGTHTNTTNQ